MSGTELPPSRGGSRRLRGLILCVLIAAAGSAAWGILSRTEARAALRLGAEDRSVLTVSVTRPQRGPLFQDLVLPGSVQAYTDAPIYARANGYLKRWFVDIGARVRAGQLMAELETPEVDQELHQAEADLATAEANERLAATTAIRWQGLVRSGSVSQQSVDEKLGDAAAKKALVASARANVARLRELQSFKRIEAPFDGVVTARNVDVGALVDSGSAAGHELFRLAKIDKLRVYVQLPQRFTTAIEVGMGAELSFAERPGRTFPARLARTANALDPVARTLLVELEADNADGLLLPGSYTQVHLKIPNDPDVLRLPINTLLYRPDGVRVGTIDGKNRVVLKTVTLGRDFGSSIEVLTGLAGDDTVVVSPPDSLETGQAVRIARAAAVPAVPPPLQTRRDGNRGGQDRGVH